MSRSQATARPRKSYLTGKVSKLIIGRERMGLVIICIPELIKPFVTVVSAPNSAKLKNNKTRSQSDITDAPCLKFYTINTLFIHRWHTSKFVHLLPKMSFT